MSNLKKVLFSPLGLFGILLILGGGLIALNVMWGIVVGGWMLLCGMICVALAFPLVKAKHSLWWQLLLMSVCPLVMLGYMLAHEYFYEDEFICLIPAGYTGKVIIKYEAKNGQQAEFEDGKMLLKIGEDGTLETQHERKKIIDLLNSEYYYVLPDQNRVAIPEGIGDSTKLQIIDLQFYATDSASFQTFYVGIPTELNVK